MRIHKGDVSVRTEEVRAEFEKEVARDPFRTVLQLEEKRRIVAVARKMGVANVVECPVRVEDEPINVSSPECGAYWSVGRTFNR